MKVSLYCKTAEWCTSIFIKEKSKKLEKEKQFKDFSSISSSLSPRRSSASIFLRIKRV
jgi:hypothetical protein